MQYLPCEQGVYIWYIHSVGVTQPNICHQLSLFVWQDTYQVTGYVQVTWSTAFFNKTVKIWAKCKTIFLTYMYVCVLLLLPELELVTSPTAIHSTNEGGFLNIHCHTICQLLVSLTHVLSSHVQHMIEMMS